MWNLFKANNKDARMASLTFPLCLYLELLADLVLYFTVFIGFEQVNLHWGEACHTFHIVNMWKHKMIVHAQLGMEFHWEEKDGRETFQLGQFHMIFVWSHFFLILGLYCSQYMIYNIHNKKVFTIFLKIDYIMTLNNHMQ